MSKTIDLILGPAAPAHVKITLIVFTLWLSNVLFVVLHELGHVVSATSSGASILAVHISLTGIQGSTTYTLPDSGAETCLILAGGMLATTLATLAMSWLRTELPVYVLGLRTVESLTNFTPGSDMAALLVLAGPGMYIMAFALAAVATVSMGSTLARSRWLKKEMGATKAPGA